MAEPNRCPVCNIEQCTIKLNPGPDDFYLVSCKRCGNYSLSDTAFHSKLSTVENRHLLSGAIRNRYENGEKLYFSFDDFENLLNTVKIPSNSDESIHLLLKHISNKLKSPGSFVRFTPFYDFPLLFVKGPDDFKYYLNQARKLNYVEFDSTYLGYRLTMKGSRYLEELNQKAPVDLKKRILVFISYSTKDKEVVGKIKRQLENFWLEVFVGHDDINPSSEWVKEIFRNLKKCDIFIPYLTKDFKKSNWTDQESGIAECLKKCILPLKIKYDPYGFINKYQALDISDKELSSYGEEIVKRIIKENKFPQLKDIIIEKFINSNSFIETENIWRGLFLIEEFSKKQINSIVKAYLENDQIYNYSLSEKHLWRLLGNREKMIEPVLYKRLRKK